MSATEWMASASRDAEPVMMKPMNFEIAIPRFARKAAMIALRLPSCTGSDWHNGRVPACVHAWTARGSRRVGHGGRPGDRGRHLARSCRRRSVDRGQLPARRRGREGDRRGDRSRGRIGPLVRRRGRGLRGRADDGRRRGERLRLRRHPREQRRHRFPRQVGGRHRPRRARAARSGARARRAPPLPARAAVDAHAPPGRHRDDLVGRDVPLRRQRRAVQHGQGRARGAGVRPRQGGARQRHPRERRRPRPGRDRDGRGGS